MNLDDFVQSIPDTESDLRQDLKHWILNWKLSDASLEQLDSMIEKWLANVWFKEQSTFDKVRRDWHTFSKESIQAVHGLTLNERLYLFGLFDQWDHSDGGGQEVLRAKLKASA